MNSLQNAILREKGGAKRLIPTRKHVRNLRAIWHNTHLQEGSIVVGWRLLPFFFLLLFCCTALEKFLVCCF